MTTDSGFHRRSDAQSLVNPAIVVMHVVERNRRLVIRQLLAVAISEPSKAPDRHAHGKVLALHKLYQCRSAGKLALRQALC